MAPSRAGQDVATPKLVASASARHLAIIHTSLSYSAFLLCLAVGSTLHFKRIVKNQWYGWPDEWWPSVSATIGDWYPERNIFQIAIAVTAGPRFAVVLLSYLLARAPSTSLPGFVASCGLLRTLMCGGWVYITSSDSGDMHDVMMISYLVLNIPWMVGTTLLTPQSTRPRKYRVLAASAFFATLVPLIYFYIQHKVHRKPGAYSIYAIFEWSLILLDVAFDSVTILDLGRLEIRILDTGHSQNVATPHLAPPIAGSQDRTPTAFENHVIAALASTSAIRLFLAEAYLDLIFWTLLTALGPMIFYSSVWSMGLSGWEVLIFATLSPALLGSRHIRAFVIHHPHLFRFFTLAGLAAFKIDDEGLARLQVVAFAIATSILQHVARWYDARDQPELFEQRVQSFLMGLIGTVLLKFANFSLNPLWPIMNDRTQGRMITGGYNTLGLALGVLSWITTILTTPAQKDASQQGAEDQGDKSKEEKTAVPAVRRRGSRLASAAGFGSLFFLVHWLFTDSGTSIAWTWSGYPIRGPTAMPHGIYIIAQLSAGALASFSSTVPTAWPMLGVALAGSALLYSVPGWSGFQGASALAFFCAASFPAFVNAAVRHTPGSTFFIAMLVYAVLELASVWTVAYAFVPGGPYLRERTDLVLGAAMVLVSVGFVNARSCVRGQPRVLGWKASDLRLVKVLALCLIMSVVVIYHRRPTGKPLPYHPDARLITAGIWTVHFGMDGRMWESQRRMGDFIRRAQLDIVGLLESDVHRIVGGNRDITQYIAHELNMYADIGPGPNKHTWGAALLSKFPILNSTHHLLPSPHGELAPAIHATLDIYGELVDVVVAHNGQEEDPLDRELQSKELGRIMREAFPRPVIFLGYVVTKPHAERPSPYKLLVEDGLVNDVDPADDDRWCEYVLFRGLDRVAYARLNRGSNPSITDTELQAAKFVVPRKEIPPQPQAAAEFDPPTSPTKKGPFVVDLTEANRVDEGLVPPAHRFPAEFKGDGVNGHFFHVLRDGKGELNALYYVEKKEAEARHNAIFSQAVDQCAQQ